MIMSNKEIIRSFKEARDPSLQIQVLADMNTCRPEDIAYVLKDVELDDTKRIYGANGDRTMKECVGNKIKKLTLECSTGFNPRWNEKMEALMKEQYITDNMMARKCDVTPTAIGAWRRGVTMPRMDRAVMMARALGTTLDAIFTED